MRKKWLALVLPLLVGGPAWAVFVEPIRVTDGTGAATQTATGLDLANNAYISSVIGERIQVKIIGPGLNVDAPILATGLGQGDPDFETNSQGTTYLSFSQLDDQFIGEGREIYYTHNNGGRFLDPIRITRNRIDDFAPRLALDWSGSPHLVWAQSVGEATRIVYWNIGMQPGEETVLVEGEYPALFVDKRGTVHIAYSRNNDLRYNTLTKGVLGLERRITTTSLEPESSVSIGVDPGGNVLVCFESRHSLYFASKSSKANVFSPPRLLDRGEVLNPKMRVRLEGQVTIVYAKEGDVFLIQGQSTSLNLPQQITSTTEIESYPSVEVDISNNIHLSFIRDGDVYYTHNAEQPSADFTAVPTIGEVPLTVEFADLSSGPIQRWAWSFGDGSVAVERNPKHVYTEPGLYEVSLEVSGPGATVSQKVRDEYIFVQHPFNTLRIPDQLVIPGQKDVWFPVLASHKEPIQAFQLMGLFDSNILDFRAYDIGNSVLAGVGPELLIVNDLETRFEVGCIFDYEPPFNKPRLAAGENQTLFNLRFDVTPDAPMDAETQVQLVNNKELSTVLNIFTVDGFTKVPALTPSTVKILVFESPFPKFFVRGDVDGNREIEITDAIRLLGYLFLGEDEPPCLDAADVTDRGEIDISGGIVLLGFLFLGGPAPSVPFPEPGLDPTDDALGTCY